MIEQLSCTACGALLNADYVCPYCGSRYKKPENAPNTTTIVINNYGTAPTGIPGFTQPQAPVPEPEPEPETTQENNTSEPVASEEEAPKSAITEFVNNSFGLMVLLLGAAITLCIIGVNSNNDFMIFLGIIIGAIFLFLSSKMTPKKKKDNEERNDDK